MHPRDWDQVRRHPASQRHAWAIGNPWSADGCGRQGGVAVNTYGPVSRQSMGAVCRWRSGRLTIHGSYSLTDGHFRWINYLAYSGSGGGFSAYGMLGHSVPSGRTRAMPSADDPGTIVTRSGADFAAANPVPDPVARCCCWGQASWAGGRLVSSQSNTCNPQGAVQHPD
jgi:hypothetical protein